MLGHKMVHFKIDKNSWVLGLILIQEYLISNFYLKGFIFIFLLVFFLKYRLTD